MPPDDAAGEAWDALCRALAGAARHVREGADASPPGRAEGFAYVAGLAAAGLRDAFAGDPDFPRFHRNPCLAAKWGAENADNLYLWAPVRADAEYRVFGARGSAFELLFETRDGHLQQGHVRAFASRLASELAAGPEGGFELRVGGAPRAGNWLPLDDGARWLVVRQYFADWEREEPARLAIERVGADGAAPPRPTPESVAERLAAAAAWVEDSARTWNEWVAALRAAHVPGELAPARAYAGGADAIAYGNDVFRLGPEEALVVECAPPDARYWSFQLCDGWFRSLDYAHRQTSLNHAQARLDGDGRVRIVVAHADPGVPNWLDTEGRAEGILQYRWIWARSNPRPTARVVPFARVREALPPDTPALGPAERAVRLAARRRHVALREGPA